MPLLRCTDDGCRHEWFERSWLAEGSECEVCGEPTRVVGVDDDPPGELAAPAEDSRAHPGHARERARQVAREHGFGRPPVVVHKIARDLGFTVKVVHGLGPLRGRMAGKTIEVSADEPPVAQRFTVGHELGHHFLGTCHGDCETAEQEANAFAGELLVPGWMLRAEIAETTDAAELRRRFKVSRDVLRIAAKHHKLDGQLTGDV
jgi:hypothetical protein